MVGKKKGKKIKKFSIVFQISLVMIIIILAASTAGFFTVKTGLLQMSYIDETDSSYWGRNDLGFILGSEEIILNGSGDTCWLMIHGYGATPHDFSELSEKVNSKFGDYVYAPLLLGHGEVPSKIMNLTLDDWYSQVSEIYDSMSNECDQINVVGFSFGGALSTRLSEEKDVKNTYLVAPYLFPLYNKIKIFDVAFYVDVIADLVHYSNKFTLSQINDPEGLKNYIAYWVFPLQPVKYSVPFLNQVKKDLGKIENPILIQHSTGDKTADYSASKLIYSKVSSKEKELVLFTDSNHVILFDYDKEEAMQNILDFEEKHR